MTDGRASVTKAVILAGGLGTRMREERPGLALAGDQAAAAAAGMKGMIPIGRPFLDYVLSALADAGITDVCIVVGPAHDAIRDHYGHTTTTRLRVHFALQPVPRGTADAVLAAEAFAGGDAFLVLNADNYYPVDALAALRAQRAPALIGFERDALVAGGMSPDRIMRFALLDVSSEGRLRRIVEKPSADTPVHSPALVSMNSWLFDATIFEACRAVAPSVRGELELPQAVQWLIDERDAHVTVLPVAAPVLDLSSRSDIPVVAERLRNVRVEL